MLVTTDDSQHLVPRFDAVLLVASQGGHEAMGMILSKLPAQFPAPVLVVQHLAPHVRSCLDEILQRRTRLLVRWVTTGARLRPNTVFVAPPGSDLELDHNREVVLLGHEPKYFGRPSGDRLLLSAASVLGSRALAVVLSGNGSDGCWGAAKVKECGGVVIAQDPRTCVASGMPRAAIADRIPNFVLPLDNIASALVSLVAVQGGAGLFGIAAA